MLVTNLPKYNEKEFPNLDNEISDQRMIEHSYNFYQAFDATF